MASFTIKINKQMYTVEAESETPLLWVIRDHIGLTGTKYGCGVAQCGACTVHIDSIATRSCSVPVSAVGTRAVTTIEGLSSNGEHPLQKAWIEESVPQCGYCQAGQVMTAAALLRKNRNPSGEEIIAAMRGNICRCGTYPRIKKAIEKAVAIMNETKIRS